MSSDNKTYNELQEENLKLKEEVDRLNEKIYYLEKYEVIVEAATKEITETGGGKEDELNLGKLLRDSEKMAKVMFE